MAPSGVDGMEESRMALEEEEEGAAGTEEEKTADGCRRLWYNTKLQSK